MQRQRKGSGERWIDAELAGCEFSDVRLNKRFRKLMEQLSSGIGESIPWACQDWASTKAAYRFLSNPQVNEAEILQGHFQATRERLVRDDAPILMLHDTTEFNYHRDDTAAIGILHKNPVRRKRDGTLQHTIVCGLLMHSSLAVTTDGLPLGLAAIKFWSRDQFYGCNALKKKGNPTRGPIEVKESFRWLSTLRQTTSRFDKPQRCIHIGDRESDIYELFCTAQQVGTHFLVRTCVDRLAGDGDHTIADEMADVEVKGQHRIQVQDINGNPTEAVLDIKYRRIRIQPPIGKQKQYPALSLTVL